jgi:hypothetical protein
MVFFVWCVVGDNGRSKMVELAGANAACAPYLQRGLRFVLVVNRHCREH